MSKKKILFLSHEASRTGAPLVLLHFIKWLKLNTDISFIILLKRDGELRSDFEALAPTYIYSFPYTSIITFKDKIKANWNTYIEIPRYYQRLQKTLEHHSIDLIYANTIGNGEVLDFLSFLKCPVITHIHELKFGIFANGERNLNSVLKHSNLYIAASGAVKDNLVNSYSIEEKKVDIIHEFIPIEPNLYFDLNTTKQALDIPESAFIVGASGTMDLRKGFDLLVPLVLEVYKQTTKDDIYFIWIGGDLNNPYYHIISLDAAKTNVKKYIRLPGSQKDPLKFFACFDVFALLSREDPFPLVCLESAALGIPIICFKDSGGMPELIEEDCGFVVPYLDIQSMASKIIYLKENPNLRIQLGEAAKKKVTEQHSVVKTAPKILEVIKKWRVANIDA